MSDVRHSANTASAPAAPRWLEEIDLGLSIAPHFLIYGNIADLHLAAGADGPAPVNTTMALWLLLGARRFEFALIYDRNKGLSVLPPDALARAQAAFASLPWLKDIGKTNASGDRQIDPKCLTELMEAINAVSSPRSALIIEDASRVLGTFEDQAQELVGLTAWRKQAQQASLQPRGKDDLLYNPTFFLCDSVRDLPTWFVVGNDRLRVSQAALPDFSTRNYYIQTGAPFLFPDVDLSSPAAKAGLADLTIRSEGLTLVAIQSVMEIARDKAIPLDRINDAIRTYKIGLPRDPWREGHLRDRLSRAEITASASVIGQNTAVRNAVDILKRSYLGLSGAQSGSSPNRPRGVLFFAGPTGVGKTELAKSLSEILFGDKDSFVRFDMSEFSAEHSEARLIGAPPGYIGHDAGGELVNAIRRRPFSVLLFDEIEKAHRRILDKFLQILDDGRLTDGRGDTVYFSDAVIVFTSNLGVIGDDGATTEYGARYEDLRKNVLNGIRDEFKFRMRRPELLNRIGENILVFDFIRKENGVAEKIFDKILAGIGERLRKAHDYQLELDNGARNKLLKLATEDLTNGGRGIANVIETCLVNPLARSLFDQNPAPGSRVRVDRLGEDDYGYVAHITCKSV